MGRFTLPRDLYYGKDSLENLKNIDGKSYRRIGRQFNDVAAVFLIK